ncbi:MAG: helix-turn-helix transcriptional regulator, partial [Chloroflexota bacterium]
LTRKYIEWRNDAVGHDRTISDFAEMVGVTQPTMSRWMKKGGQTPRGQQSIVKLVRAFGGEVYDILGLPRPQTGEEIDLQKFPAQLRRDLYAAAREANRTLERRGLYGNDPEAEKVIIEIFERYGFRYTRTSTPDTD